ncbi:MAG: hypothetical protein WCN88_04245 [Candidatus Falkowbacteria bacterium]
MKTNLKKWIAGATTLGIIVAAIIGGEALVNAIVLNWPEIFGWLTTVSVFVACVCVTVFIVGYFFFLTSRINRHQRGFARLVKKLTWKTAIFFERCKLSNKDMAKISKVLFIIAILVFAVNTFPLFNHFDLLRLWLIIVGGVLISALIILLVVGVENDVIKNTAVAVITFSALLLGLMYYLDIFIFSWNRPWITGVVAILLTLFLTTKLIRERRRARKEKLEQAQYNAKTAADEIVKMKNRLEAKSKLEMRLSSLSFYDLVIYYFNEKKENELIYWDDIVSIYIEAMRALINDNTGKLEASADQKKQIARFLSQKKSDKSSKFYKVIAAVFSESDGEAVLFSNVDGATTRVVPEAFAQCALKKEVVASFLSQEFDEKYKRLLYNKVKREFAHNEFYGLINALIYSYQKTWDEELSAKILDRINEIFIFANDCLNSMWQKSNRTSLRKHMEAIHGNCLLSGVHVSLPLINQEKEEEL